MQLNYHDEERKVIEAFKAIWTNYPEPAMLINRGKKVMALNWACRQAGPKLGSFCHEISGCLDSSDSCLINQCLDSRQAKHMKIDDGKKQWTIHWVPIEGHPDYCIHFFAGSND